MTDPADDIAKALRSIADTWPLMLPTMPRPGMGEHPKIKHRKITPPPPAPIHVLSLRYDVDALLSDWARLVKDERDLHTDAGKGDVPTLTAWLLTHAAWLGAHDTGQSSADEITDIATRCEDIAHERRSRSLALGPCPQPDCGGKLTLRVRQDSGQLARVRCSDNTDHTWPAGQWDSLTEHIDR